MKVLIIGGTSGIGYYVGKELSKKGHEVLITTHTTKEKTNLEEKLKEEHLNITVYKLDVCNKKDIDILDQLTYDVVWLNQAIGVGGAVLSIKEEEIREIYETNVFGTILCLQKAYNNMEKRNIKGKIIVTSSLITNFDLKYLGMYASTKAALNQLCYTISQELKEIKSKISITILQLGAYETGFNQVMINNKETCNNEDSTFYKYNNKITKKQKLLFSLIEKSNYNEINREIIKLIETNNPKLKIKLPVSAGIIAKIYQFIKH